MSEQLCPVESQPAPGNYEIIYADDLAMCDRFVEQVEAAEAAYCQGDTVAATKHLNLLRDLLRRHEAGEAV